MLTSHRVMMVKQKIIDYHGRVTDIRLYDTEPPLEVAKTKGSTADAKNESNAFASQAEGAEGEDEENKEDDLPKYKTYTDPSMTLYEIFDDYGVKNKKEVDKAKVLWYDFTPYNSKDPILLSLMIKDKETGKTI